MAGIWDELGIAPTRDRTAIKRGYAARLKTVSLDADPQGFARLRAAYEQALALAEAPVPQAAAKEAPHATQSRPEPVDRPDTAETAEAVENDGVADGLGRGDVVAAASWLLSARPGLTLAQDLRLTDRLGWAMAQDGSLPGAAVCAAAGQLGWAAGPLTGAWGGLLRARLDGEQWLAALRRDAASGTRLLGGARAVSARIMLGTGSMRALGMMANDRMLRRRYGEYLLHAGAVGGQFDAGRIAAVQKVLTAKPDKPASPLTLLFGIAIIAWALGAIAGGIDPEIRDGVTGAVAVGLVLLLWARKVLRRLRRRRRD